MNVIFVRRKTEQISMVFHLEHSVTSHALAVDFKNLLSTCSHSSSGHMSMSAHVNLAPTVTVAPPPLYKKKKREANASVLKKPNRRRPNRGSCITTY